MLAGRLGRPARARREDVEQAVAVRLVRRADDDLVFLRDLPCEASRQVARVVVREHALARAGPIQIRLGLMRGVPLLAVGEELVAAFACRDIEPHLALPDGSAERQARLSILLQRADALRIQVADRKSTRLTDSHRT